MRAGLQSKCEALSMGLRVSAMRVGINSGMKP